MTYSSVTDAYGLSRANTFFVLNIPASGNAFVFRVKQRANPGYPTIDYGQIPITSGQTLSLFSGGTASAPAAGAFAAESYLQTSIQFPYTTTNFPNASGTLYDTNDIWHISGDENPNTLFDVIQEVVPAWLRVNVNIPTGQTQQAFQIGRLAPTTVGSSFGFRRGTFRVQHIPGLVYGYNYGNDTSIPTFTNVRFHYAEYTVEIPRDPNLIFGILSKSSSVPVNWQTLPVTQYTTSLKQALLTAYGFEGFPLFQVNQAQAAVQLYSSLLGKAAI
jgi:hypothetical protein